MLINILHNRVRRRNGRFGYQSRFLDLDHCRMHYYEREGTQPGKTLVLLHGLGTSSSTWVHLLPALDRTWRVLAPDLPGFGFSTLTDRQSFFSVSELHDAVNAFVGQKVKGPFVLLGHSLGGWLAVKYAAGRSDSVRRLILVNNAGILHEGAMEQARAFELVTMRDLKRLMNILWLRYPWYFRPFYPAILHDLRERHVTEFVRSIQPGDFINDDLKKLPVRVNIVWGTADRLFAMKSVEIMRQAIPGARIDYIEDCGHVPQLEKPKEFTNIIRTILMEEAS